MTKKAQENLKELITDSFGRNIKRGHIGPDVRDNCMVINKNEKLPRSTTHELCCMAEIFPSYEAVIESEGKNIRVADNGAICHMGCVKVVMTDTKPYTYNIKVGNGEKMKSSTVGDINVVYVDKTTKGKEQRERKERKKRHKYFFYFAKSCTTIMDDNNGTLIVPNMTPINVSNGNLTLTFNPFDVNSKSDIQKLQNSYETLNLNSKLRKNKEKENRVNPKAKINNKWSEYIRKHPSQ